MKKINKSLHILSILNLTLLTACFNQQSNNHTLLIYMCGSDLESIKGYASKNINEMLEVNLDSNVEVFVLCGGSKTWHHENIDNGVNLYAIKNQSLNKIKSYGNINLGDETTLNSFILDSLNNSKFDQSETSLIFWDHGSGLIDGVCFDENFQDDSLTLLEIKNGISNHNFNYIGFDACLMANYEMLDLFKYNTDYLIFSQDLEPGTGWDYRSVLNINKKNYFEQLLKSYALKHENISSYTLSCVDLNHLDDIKEPFDEMVQVLSNDITLIDNMLDGVLEFGYKSYSNDTLNLFDLGQCLDNLNISYDFSNAIKKENGFNRNNVSGLNFFFPKNRKDKLNDYFAIIDDEDYEQLLNSFIDIKPEVPIQFNRPLFINDNTVSFIIEESSKDYFYEAYYCLVDWDNNYDDRKGFFFGGDDDIKRHNNLFTINFNGNWIYLNDQVLYCQFAEQNNDITSFYCPVLIDDDNYLLVFDYDEHTKHGEIRGYMDIDWKSSRLHEIKYGETITPLYVNIYDEINNYFEGDPIIYDEYTTLNVKPIKDGQYIYYILLSDIYGNGYYGGQVLLNKTQKGIEYLDVDLSNVGMIKENK